MLNLTINLYMSTLVCGWTVESAAVSLVRIGELLFVQSLRVLVPGSRSASKAPENQ